MTVAVDLDQDLLRTERLRSIKDARDQARRIERKADEADPNDKDAPEWVQSLPYWKTVRDLAEKSFAEQIKDIEIAAYAIEALVRLEGFAGLRKGFQVSRELVEQSWDQLYPMPDEYEGVAVRVLPLARLNGEEGDGILIEPINRVPITEGNTFGPYSAWHQAQANEFNRFSDRDKQARSERGEVTPDRFKKAVTETDPSFYRKLVDDLTGCQAEFDALNQALDEKCGRDDNGHSLAPPSSAIRGLLEQIMLGVKSVAISRLGAEPVSTATAGGAAGATQLAGGGSAAGSAPAGHPQSREDAFRLLAIAAEFFERTEPQSLLPAQIRKAIRWGRLSPDQYYKELLEDQNVVQQLFKLVGLPLADSQSENS